MAHQVLISHIVPVINQVNRAAKLDVGIVQKLSIIMVEQFIVAISIKILMYAITVEQQMLSNS
ncbi:MAG TPA: hypothetical protein DD413_03745 [Ruminococcus sp.]|nr:hypothetical protein [Ruminococcus sp.]